MTETHSILRKAWDEGHAGALQVLADKFDEDGVPDAGEYLRLACDDACDDRYCLQRRSRLERLVNEMRYAAQLAGWATDRHRHPAGATFAALIADGNREVILVRPKWGLRRLLVEEAGGERVIRTWDGGELFREPWSPERSGFGGPGPFQWDFEPSLLTGAIAGPTRFGRWGRQSERRLLAAAMTVHDLPAALLPLAAAHLSVYLLDRTRRAAAGEAVAGLHEFACGGDGGWKHVKAFEPRGSWRVSRRFIRDARDRGWPRNSVRARLLVRVTAGRRWPRVRPALLIWQPPRRSRIESVHRPNADAFRWAAGELRLPGELAARFVLDAPVKARALFAARP